MNKESKYFYTNKISWQKFPKEESAFAYNITTNKYYEFNDVEYYVWMYISTGEKSISNIIQYISDLYSIPCKEIEIDIFNFIKNLVNVGLIEENERN